MKLQFKHQKFQADAAKAVVDVLGNISRIKKEKRMTLHR